MKNTTSAVCLCLRARCAFSEPFPGRLRSSRFCCVGASRLLLTELLNTAQNPDSCRSPVVRTRSWRIQRWGCCTEIRGSSLWGLAKPSGVSSWVAPSTKLLHGNIKSRTKRSVADLVALVARRCRGAPPLGSLMATAVLEDHSQRASRRAGDVRRHNPRHSPRRA